ncbi:class III extradiol ring-cleavage dioxygenase [Melaminivora jejuensis]|uniref:DODA-type extradiol aromatic ring-opening family dioxygenase n=1 Tax=Melaminivora jejuensis TaxID=1267217 RepID=UPI001AE0673A|nr:class III extradiol ring-cleavage dioxygenase [Melaminivora jejuensis]UHJ64087.1 dioxygenase [Melaminivora jejuensis]
MTTLPTAPVPRQPVLFIPHGAGPCFFMDWSPPDAWDRTAAWLRGIPASLPARPAAIVLVTAHWLEAQPTLGSAAQPALLFDYHGFPPHTYELTYPAPGAPQLARQASALLAQAGFAPQLDERRGLDHGSFIPLKVAFPEADIPVLQMSLLSSLDAAEHLRLGQALQPLRDAGALIIGSGMSYHNMRGYGDPRSTPASSAFDHWLAETVALPEAQRHARLADWAAASAPAGRLAHPAGREEHLLPLLVAAGAAGASPGARVFTDRVLQVDISAFRFD